MLPLPVSASQPRFRFSDLNTRFKMTQGLGSLFFLTISPILTTTFFSVRDVFSLPHGVFMIHCWIYHWEDVDFEYAEGVSHYITYNADTRCLTLYPEVCATLVSHPPPPAPHHLHRVRHPHSGSRFDRGRPGGSRNPDKVD